MCQHQVGSMYYKGQGVAVDFEQARAWFEKAEAKHSPKSGLQLGMMYANGDGSLHICMYLVPSQVSRKKRKKKKKGGLRFGAVKGGREYFAEIAAVPPLG